ncbi:MAG: hypothetical protein WAK55_05445, partial [Xanthobacteraceae bacterium]
MRQQAALPAEVLSLNVYERNLLPSLCPSLRFRNGTRALPKFVTEMTERCSGGAQWVGMISKTLSRYFAMRFLGSVIGSFFGVVALAAMIDYVELMRRGEDWPNATAWVLAKISMYRVPQLAERIMPFSVLI